ncbi:hypothetical protein HJG60_008851 [Phyllostomus discolor]|uniref:Uncharacterized protein n=1 Tax=Phyllostomus discolor TaxID=89673 RepID=A0A833YZ61_9CHIR|nr:hypothetical protein HJG60_008851 [Phyllostomus discolor]
MLGCGPGRDVWGQALGPGLPLHGDLPWPVVLGCSDLCSACLYRRQCHSLLQAWLPGLLFRTWAWGDLLAVGGDQEVNWAQGDVCLLPTASLFTRLIFSPGQRSLAVKRKAMALLLSASASASVFLSAGRGLDFHPTFQTLHIYRYRYRCIGM